MPGNRPPRAPADPENIANILVAGRLVAGHWEIEIPDAVVLTYGGFIGVGAITEINDSADAHLRKIFDALRCYCSSAKETIRHASEILDAGDPGALCGCLRNREKRESKD